jgi:short-subunit dehydrogenase
LAKRSELTTGRWSRAVVTGASSGIGESIARRLAAANVGLILVARRRDRLEALASELREISPSRIEVMGADLTDEADLARVEERLGSSDAPVDLLVNDAGAMRLGVFPSGDEEGHIRLNVTAMVRLTAAALPAMRRRGRGTILNVSSGAAFHPHPYAAVYGASKAFVNSFSEAIREENRGQGISVTVVCPGFTRTELPERGGFDVASVPRAVWMEADEVAERALAAASRGRAACVPGLLNKIDVAFARYAPRWIVVRSVEATTRRFSREVFR